MGVKVSEILFIPVILENKGFYDNMLKNFTQTLLYSLEFV